MRRQCAGHSWTFGALVGEQSGWRTEWLENYVKTVGELGMVTRQEWLGKLGWNGKRTMNGWVTRPEQLE